MKRIVTICALAGVILPAAGTGCRTSHSDAPITVRLSWDNPVDLDLLIDEQPAHRQGGSPDRGSGGEEVFTVKRESGEYIVAVQNLSGHASAQPRITIDGVWEKENSPIISFSDEPYTATGTVAPNARRDRWIVCAIDTAKGMVTKIDQME
ncbi:MAG: hypothetical protein AAB229_01985 [Candidatus Hydrogenedentota bacterium]